MPNMLTIEHTALAHRLAFALSCRPDRSGEAMSATSDMALTKNPTAWWLTGNMRDSCDASHESRMNTATNGLRHAAVIRSAVRLFTPNQPIGVNFGEHTLRALNVEIQVLENSDDELLVIQAEGQHEALNIDLENITDAGDRAFLAEQIAVMRTEMAEQVWNRRLNPDRRTDAGQVTNVETGETKIVFDRIH